jgi:hypothetical protein
MFTYDLRSDSTRSATANRDPKLQEFDALRKQLGIHESQVYVIPKPTLPNNPNKTKTVFFVHENPELIDLFFDIHKKKVPPAVRQNIIVFSDGGHSFKVNGNNVFLQLGFGRHIVFPLVVHQFLSPNDNNYHGVAKAWWRKKPPCRK